MPLYRVMLCDRFEDVRAPNETEAKRLCIERLKEQLEPDDLIVWEEQSDDE